MQDTQKVWLVRGLSEQRERDLPRAQAHHISAWLVISEKQ